jgi:hypothetical protein
MSSTKLTLTISDADLIQKAKVYAKETGRSLSNLIENYLRTVTSNTELIDKEYEISPLVKSLTGIMQVPDDWDYKEALIEALEEKYMKE